MEDERVIWVQSKSEGETKVSKELAEIKNHYVAEYVPSSVMTIEDAKKDLESLYQVMKSVMRNGIDYDTIKGTGKPTLLKPGAERLMRFFGLSQKVDLVEKIVDWDKPLFYYHYKVTIFKKYPDFEIEVAECDGSCNSFEDKYRWRWVSGSKLSNYGISDVTGLSKRTTKYGLEYRIPNPDIYSLVNTIKKMAIKRAFVGAVLLATGASNLFTQDVEDFEFLYDDQPQAAQQQQSQPNRQVNRQPEQNQSSGSATQNQLKALFAAARSKLTNDEIKELVQFLTGKSSSKELTKQEASELIDHFNKRSKEELLEEIEEIRQSSSVPVPVEAEPFEPLTDEKLEEMMAEAIMDEVGYPAR